MTNKIIGLSKHIIENIRNINKIKFNYQEKQIIVKFLINIFVLLFVLSLIGLIVYFLGIISSGFLVFVLGYLLKHRPHLYIYYDLQDKLVYLCNDGFTAAKNIEYQKIEMDGNGEIIKKDNKCKIIHHLVSNEKITIDDFKIFEIKYECVVTKRKFVDIIYVSKSDYSMEKKYSYSIQGTKNVFAIIKQEFKKIYRILKQ